MIVRRLMEELSTPRLAAVVAWVPMLAADNLVEAEERTGANSDPRISYGWDGASELGPAFGATLGLVGAAWDVYLLYAAGVRWDGPLPPPPARWMHQLPATQGAPPHLRLDAATLTAWARELLEGVEPQ